MTDQPTDDASPEKGLLSFDWRDDALANWQLALALAREGNIDIIKFFTEK